VSHHTLLTEYKHALSTQRWEAVAPLIHDNACFIFSEGSYFGKAAVETAFRNTFDLIKNEHYSIKNLVWIYVGEVRASCTYDFAWSGVIDGKLTSGTGRGTTVVVCGGGIWQIIQEHLGPSPK